MSYPQQPGQGPIGPNTGAPPGHPQQGYPRQPPGYPQQPGYPPSGYGGYPQMPGGLPNPGGGTAIAAGVLAVFGGLWDLYGLVISTRSLTRLHVFDGITVWILATLIIGAVQAGTLLPGGIMLFLRKRAGRMLVLIGSGVATTVSVGTFVVGATRIIRGFSLAGGGLLTLVSILLSVATLVLAIVKPTAVWCGAAAPVPPYGGYPQQPGAPQGW